MEEEEVDETEEGPMSDSPLLAEVDKNEQIRDSALMEGEAMSCLFEQEEPRN